MARKDAPSFQSFLSRFRQSRGLLAGLNSEDARWALVSTSVTALVAGTVAWLGAGTVPQTAAYADDSGHSRSLLPYQVFMHLAAAAKPNTAAYASVGSSASLTPKQTIIIPPPAQLDNSLAAEEMDSADDESSGINTTTITMESGDTLVSALTDAGASGDDASAAVMAMKKVFDPRLLKAGQSFTLTFAPPDKTPVAKITYTPPNAAAAQNDSGGETQPAGKLLSVAFSPSIEHEVTISRGADNGFSAQDVVKKLVAQFHRAGGKIDSSLYLAAMQAGIPADVVVQMIHMFSYQVDFQRDIHPGDTFQVLFDYYYTPAGKPAKEGNIAFATMTLGGKTYTLYRYADGDGVDYLDAHGRSAKSLLMKTPVDGARISSGFGMRFHPVLGYTRMHKGVDFAVPVGTPVMAAGAGTVMHAGPSNGYGNFLLIQNTKDYSTGYGHLSRFAPGIHAGVHVRQGQVVAFSGNTGITTGPHLHYEIRIDGNQVNPLTVKFATGIQLEGRQLKKFMADKGSVDHKLASMPLETRVADNSTGLRAGKE